MMNNISAFLVILLLAFAKANTVSFDAEFEGSHLYTTMGFGYPAQKFRVRVGIDFGLSENGPSFVDEAAFVLPSITCRGCQSAHYFNETASMTAHRSPASDVPPSCSEDESKLFGHLDTDRLTFGRNLLKSMTAFVVDRNQDCSELNAMNYDGIMQLCPQEYVPRDQFIPLALYDAGVISKPWFTLVSNSKNPNVVTFNIGEVAPEKTIHWNPIGTFDVNWGLVSLNAFSLTIGSLKQKVFMLKFTAFDFVAKGPKVDVEAFYKVINAEKTIGDYHSVDCESYHHLPPMVFYDFAKPLMTIYPEEYITESKGTCYVNILPVQRVGDQSTWYFGAHAHYSNGIAFDLNKRAIGFYEKN
eukprot:TRINITY_DN67797_c0_g2_i1.p1 TRINITY_DN67797_c0_g2~~TRINITY_DN67797_c0_g2_i1.p1  ORF type:complete len:357 (-),score=109.45 TRINITY_DN67797_c0_g2_i1:555-1625(-)